MVLTKVLSINVTTGESNIIEKDVKLPIPGPQSKGIDLEKLKSLLLSKGIILSKGEVE